MANETKLDSKSADSNWLNALQKNLLLRENVEVKRTKGSSYFRCPVSWTIKNDKPGEEIWIKFRGETDESISISVQRRYSSTKRINRIQIFCVDEKTRAFRYTKKRGIDLATTTIASLINSMR